MRALATILALLLLVAAWFVLLGSDEPVPATHLRAADVGAQDTRSGADTRTAGGARPRTAGQPERPAKPGQVDPVEIIGLMMMLGASHGR